MAVKELYSAAQDGTPLPAKEFAPIAMVTPDTYEQEGVQCS